MTVAQLVPAWARELAAPEYGDPQHFERDLLHTLMEDAVNGRLDNSGPFREGQRSGLMIITPENKAGFIEGHQLRDLVPVGPANRWLLDRVVVMREAVLDFAKRRQLCPPSWWSASTPTTGSPTDACNAIPITKVKRRSFGKTPRIRDYLIQHYPDGVPDPAHCPRKVLKNVLIKWDHRLSPLDDGTLKKAIDVYNANLSKPQL